MTFFRCGKWRQHWVCIVFPYCPQTPQCVWWFPWWKFSLVWTLHWSWVWLRVLVGGKFLSVHYRLNSHTVKVVIFHIFILSVSFRSSRILSMLEARIRGCLVPISKVKTLSGRIHHVCHIEVFGWNLQGDWVIILSHFLSNFVAIRCNANFCEFFLSSDLTYKYLKGMLRKTPIIYCLSDFLLSFENLLQN